MSINNAILNKIAEALLIDYSSVFYVNAVTNEYKWYSVDPQFNSLHIEPDGEDFFANLVVDAEKVVYEEDREHFVSMLGKDRLLGDMMKGTMQDIVYRLMLDGKPTYHCLRVIRGIEDESRSGEDDYFILGVKNIDKEVRMKEERTIYNQIAAGLAKHFDTLYYIEAETGAYFEFSSNDEYKELNIPQRGSDYFSESRKNTRKFVHPDDREFVLSLHYPDVMKKKLAEDGKFSFTFRLRYSGEYKNFRHTVFWAEDKKHIIICMENIEDEINTRRKIEEAREKSITYGQIAESLAAHYDVIYYVNSKTEEYTEFTANEIFGSLDIREQGDDFFGESQKNADLIIKSEDIDRVKQALDKDRIITALDENKSFATEYRMVIDGNVNHARMTVTWSGDKLHFIIGIENIDEEVRRKKEQLQALKLANEMARRDELTGTRNKNAYREFENDLQQKLTSPEGCSPFAIAVCDINNLKYINDTQGHRAGDDYIRASCRLVRNIFEHSPVFRVGGDEFAAVLTGSDLTEKDDLLERFRSQVLFNLEQCSGPIVAVGIAEYDPAYDRRVSEVFERADSAMYANKNSLKEKAAIRAVYSEDQIVREPIPEKRRKKLNELFNAFAAVSDGTYIFFCDMKYDYSRWSRNAVDTFGLPSEYMYNAGEIWEDHIHEEDRKVYHNGIAEIFSGAAAGHDMQYRARRLNGEYDVCVCKGVVIRDPDGRAEYFGGTIRNLGLHGNIDMVTGLRNQYGFFEDLQNKMMKNTEIRVVLVGIGKFSEINEVYGYHFGNRILQMFGRYLFEHVGNAGTVYRMDGTKFAVITGLCIDDVRERYIDLRTHFRSGCNVGGRNVILDLNAGMLSVDNFRIDYQTVYSCLTFAYSESKMRRQGDLVEFFNDLNDRNKQRLEKLHAIRASIMDDHKGFFLMYQPVVDAMEERLIGAEALLRWKSDEYGMVPPDHFIPILEKDPLFSDLGEWILRTALRDAKKLMEGSEGFIINVNLSYTQLEKPNFTEMVFSALRAEDFPPDRLCLEITERCRLLDMELLNNIAVRLRSGGIRIALDDFGTGFSSVGVVKKLPFDIIKIDRSFVLKIEEDEKERAIIRSIAGLASTFGAKVCVEGIETAEMRDILRSYNIKSFQGYYYSKPLPLADFLTWKEKYLGRSK